MTLPIAPRHLKRYKQLAFLFLKHWNREGTQVGDLDLSEQSESDAGDRSLADDLEALGPTYVKVGQLLRTRPDLLAPEAYADLARLHDNVEPFDSAEARAIVERELGASVSRLFTSFEDTPVAAASLGQVHRAVLRNGTQVAVKIQRPDAEQTVREDLDVLRDVAEFLAAHSDLESRYGLCSTLAEFRRSILGELDYTLEAENLTRLADITERFERIEVPRIIGDYCSRKVLTMEFVEGHNVGDLNPLTLIERNTAPLAEELFRAYLDQSLVYGFVHSDPHPGNLILTKDDQLALIDLGQVTIIPEDLRERLLRLLLAVAEQDGSDAAKIAEGMGRPLEDYDGTGFRDELARLVAREGGKRVGDVRLGPILVEVARLAGTHGLRIPAQLGVLGKTILNLEEVAQILDPKFEAASVLREHAPEVITQRLADDLSPGAVVRKGLEAKQFAEALPRRIDALLETAAEGRFRVQMELQGEDRVVEALMRMANRVTSGLVMAALIVGASLLMRVETPFTILGYPGLAILLFTLAALGGVHLLYRIWRTSDSV